MISVINNIEKLRHNTLTSIDGVQEVKTPSIYNLSYEIRRAYFFKNVEYRDNKKLILLVANLPVNMNLTRDIFIDSMKNMVDNKEIKPFLLFISGKLIKWSDIQLVFNHNYRYIVISNYDVISYYVPVITPIEMIYVYNNWTRFSHNGGTVRPASPAELTSWRYDTVGENIICTINSETYIGFVSKDLYDSYVHQFTILATGSNDDDVIGTVIAYHKDPISGKEYTLSAIRSPGTMNGGMGVAGILAKWMIVYNFGQSDTKLILNGGNHIATAPGVGWDTMTIGCTIKIERTEDIINAVTTQFNSNVLDMSTELIVNLNSDPVLSVFKGPKAYGYSCYSQPNSTYKYVSFIDKKGGKGINVDINCETISLPPQSVYKENCNIPEANTIFSFDSVGYFTITPAIISTIVTLNTGIHYESAALIPGRRQAISPSFNYDISKTSPIIFKNGKLYTAKDSIKFYGLNVFMIDGGVYYNNTVFYKLFYYDENKSKDNILNIKNRPYAITQITNSVASTGIKNLVEPFDFVYDKNLLYEENINNSLKYIMKYNSGLMNDIYKDVSNVVSRTYTGLYIKSLINTEGYVQMSMRIENSTMSGVIIFVNGDLYKYYNRTFYLKKDFVFTVIDINDTDIVELLMFKNVYNDIVDINISSGIANSAITIDPKIDVDNVKVFTMHPEINEFNIDVNPNIQYEIDIEPSRISTDLIKFKFDNSFYYDKTLSLVSDRQFRYVHKIITEDCTNFKLPDDFRFCNDDDKFLVFLNSKKMDKSNYRVTTIRPDRPFTNISIYTNITLKTNDRLEVFYVADNMEEIILIPSIPLSGDIIIDKTKLSYNLSKELYLIFINGKKITNDQIVDIDANKLKIVTNVKTINNLCIVKHIKDNNILSSIFNTVSDTMTQSLNSITTSELDAYYNSNSAIVNTEINIKQNAFNMKSTMYEIVKDYWLKSDVNMGDVFAYNYDNSFFTEKDINGNTIIRSLDADIEDKFYY